jgi:hypothetical protein
MSSFVADSSELGITGKHHCEGSKTEMMFEKWKNDVADRVTWECITIMSDGEGPAALQWRGDFLCPKSESGNKIPNHVLERAFTKYNITDAKALATGMYIYRLKGSKGDANPALVLGPPKPQNSVQAAPIRPKSAQVVLKPKSNDRSLESILRCLSLVWKSEQTILKSSQNDSDWHEVLSRMETNAAVRIEAIPEPLLSPLRDILDPENSVGIGKICSLLNHIVLCLGMENLFILANTRCAVRQQDLVIGLAKSESTIHLQEALDLWVHRRLANKDWISTQIAPRVLAVSIQFPDTIRTCETLQLNAGESTSMKYDLVASIICQQGIYTAYTKNGSKYYLEHGMQSANRLWKTLMKKLDKGNAFLLFCQDTETKLQSDLLSSKTVMATEAGRRGQCAPSALQSSGTPVPAIAALAASETAKKGQIQLTDRVLNRIHASDTYRDEKNGTHMIENCASINVKYDPTHEFFVDELRRRQMDSELPGNCASIRQALSTTAIIGSLAIQTSPQYQRFNETSSWVFVDAFCEALSTKTGFTHSLQSSDLDEASFMIAFNKPTGPQLEQKYFRYIANKGIALMEAVKHHNGVHKKTTTSQIQALHVPDIAGTPHSEQFRLRSTPLGHFKSTTYAHLLHGMLAGLMEMPKLVILLPVNAVEHELIIRLLREL